MPEFEGGIMSFEIGKAAGFEIPLPYVNQCIAGKNEATLEFHLNDDAPVNLSEMRFFIPGSELAGDDPVEAFKEKVNLYHYFHLHLSGLHVRSSIGSLKF